MRRIELGEVCRISIDTKEHNFEVIGVNEILKRVKLKDFANGDFLVVSFDSYNESRHEVGTPVLYFSNDKFVSGEVVLRNKVKSISLYIDDNYSGYRERIIVPNWNNVIKFGEAY